MAPKKRFTFAMAKEKIKDLEEKLEAANVKLDDNVVTTDELKWLRFYKWSALTAYGILLGFLLAWLF